jgi:hypothetical protein
LVSKETLKFWLPFSCKIVQSKTKGKVWEAFSEGIYFSYTLFSQLAAH